MKHKWHADQKQEAFNLLDQFVNRLQVDSIDSSSSNGTNQLLAR